MSWQPGPSPASSAMSIAAQPHGHGCCHAAGQRRDAAPVLRGVGSGRSGRFRKWAGSRTIGVRAEAAILAVTGGVNTHRGAIFGMGLLCAAAGGVAEISAEGRAVVRDAPRERRQAALGCGYRARSDPALQPLALRRSDVMARAAPVLRRPVDSAASTRSAGRACGRALLPLQPGDPDAPPVQACFALIEAVCDTNVLHRGGADGMRYTSEAASSFLSQGGVGISDWRTRAAAVHTAFVAARRLEPGGCADLLAMTLLVDALESEGAPQRSSRRD